ncbi:hypothetical protein [Bradyrhizobium elkanii]|uniref:hypothetical protein n=1 Tax=Bradyrhizobium elkanii TaxID=29448 RepID=UPI002225EC7B|nr:hypothetical protein [Bradyrhizobium elkanii]MCW2130164.1 hypothetical protein [Bradyrhizobium elkanii]MCW2167841.1 hypothetical protein [Bradyrhizobium elkanii]
MSGQDRDKRLGNASSLHEAIKSLGKVSEERRAEFIHDRLMSAIDDICRERLEKPKNANRFTNQQVLVLKDIAFQIVYILDARHQRRTGFFGGVWSEFKKESGLKKLALLGGGILTVFAIIGGAYAGWAQVNNVVWPPAKKEDKVLTKPPTAAASPAAPQPTAKQPPG